MTSYPLVTITFPTFNNPIELSECLKSIIRLNYPKSKLEVVIIDNGPPTSANTKLIKRVCNPRLKTKIIRNVKNNSFAASVNQGIKMSKGKYIFITNDDVVLHEDSIKILIINSLNNPNIGVLGGSIINKKNHSEASSLGYKMNLWTGNVYSISDRQNSIDPDWIQGCAMMIPRKVINIIGLFDENFKQMFFEDFDYCFRVSKSGFLLKTFREAVFWHGESKTTNQDIKKKYFEWYKNKLRFILKNLNIINKISTLSIQFAVITPYRAIFLRDGRLLPFFRAVFVLLRERLK